jgi:N-acetylmuramoyl-L-alanine amidase
MPHTSIRRSRRRIAGALCALLIGLESVFAGPAAIRAAVPEEVVGQAFVTPTSFDPDGDGNRDTVALAYQLVRDATVSVAVPDFLARPVAPRPHSPAVGATRHLGRLTGRLVAPNAGTGSADVAGDRGTFTIDRVTKADSDHPSRPARLPAIDPGHGGSDPGAGSSGLVEKKVNLDIALRLKAMLVGAGVNVVMTREQDRRLNLASIDLTGDGSVGSADELTARIDVANQARADASSFTATPRARHR